MDRLLRPFAALGTAWRRNLFFRTRLKLTALYVGVITLIVCGFSLYLFLTIFHNLRMTDASYFTSPHMRVNFIEDAIEPTRDLIIGADLFIIAFAAALSYWFAGKTLRPVEQALESQRLFAAKASHELRTPLTVIRNDNEVTLRNPSASVAELRETLRNGIEEIDTMTSLVEHLLLIARSEQGGIPQETVAIGDVAGDVLKELKPLADAKGIMLASEAHEGSIHGEYATLKRAISNLVRNSIQHTASGGAVDMTSRAEGAKVLITVRDTGAGMTKEDMAHAFERFYKGRNDRENSGSGLGLAMVKEIVDQYEGSVSLESEEGTGTSVHIIFPSAASRLPQRTGQQPA